MIFAAAQQLVFCSDFSTDLINLLLDYERIYVIN